MKRRVMKVPLILTAIAMASIVCLILLGLSAVADTGSLSPFMGIYIMVIAFVVPLPLLSIALVYWVFKRF